jgi:Aspartate/tyrosine/aromatic aminotransferase
MATLDPGDEVVIPAPSWVAYAIMTEFAEGVPVWVTTRSENGFKLTAGELDAAITPRTKWLMLNSPSNPTGAVYSADELRALAAVLERHPHVWVLADDIYEHILFDGRRFSTFAEVAPQLADRILIVNGVSKTYAMTGWRLGYGAGPASLIRAMARMQAQCSLNPSSISQAAAVAALNGPQDIVAQRCAEFEARRERGGGAPRSESRPGSHAAAWCVLRLCLLRRLDRPVYAGGPALTSDEDVTAYLLESGVAVPNGAGYGLSPYFRLSFATSLPNLHEACRRIELAGRSLD